MSYESGNTGQRVFVVNIVKLARRLMRAPMFTGVTLLTLAVGIGANTALFSVINGALLKPLPFAEPDRLVGVWHTAPGLGIKLLNASPSTYFTYREENRVFEDIGLWSDGSVTVTGTAEPEQVDSVLLPMACFRCCEFVRCLGASSLQRTIRREIQRQ